MQLPFAPRSALVVVLALIFLPPGSLLGQVDTPAPATEGEAISEIAPTELRCDDRIDPLGVDSTPPRLSWQLRGTGRSQRQVAWQVRVAHSLADLESDAADLWDSGRVNSDTELFIPYGGRPLRTGEAAFWKVRIWDGEGHASAWSRPAQWSAGVVAAADWKARWITDPALLAWTRTAAGFHSEETRVRDAEKWIQVDLGSPQKIEAVKFYALLHSDPERLGFPERFKLEVADEPSFGAKTLVVDQTKADYPDRRAKEIELPLHGVTARYVRLTATQLSQRGGVGCFGLSQLEVLSGGKNLAVKAPVTASDSWERDGWSAQAAVDGIGGERNNPLANSTLLARREFTVGEGLQRAVVFVSGLGHYELSINGARVGQGLLTPGWTAYEKTRLYDTYDLTALLKTGTNAAALCLGGGMYNVQEGRYVKFTTPFHPLTALVQLRLEYADGRVEEVVTDEHWRVTRGPITFSNVYGGEDYDARAEPAGWTTPGFQDETWTPAVIAPAFKGELRGVSHSSPPLIAHEVFKAVTVKSIRPGVSVYDFGQNASIMPRLRVRGAAGVRVKLIPSELVREDGTVDRSSCAPGGGESYWAYTLAGTGEAEEWFPKFFYHGARYLQVELTGTRDGKFPTVESLEAVVVHSDSPAIGEFSCSNELFNRIHTLVRWAQRSNLAHVITDCPHRERLGWLEQYHLNGPALRYNFDLARLYSKCFQDMEDSQLANGLVPDIAPEYVVFGGGFRDSPEWGSAIILAAWQHYVFTGDDAPLRAHYPAMAKYVSYLESRAENGIVSHGLGDWYDLGPKPPGPAQLTPPAVTATAIYYECLRTLALIATRLEKKEDVTRYTAQAETVRAAFNRKFFRNGAGDYATGSQTAQAMPLVLDLAYPAYRDAVLAGLIHRVQERGNAISAGDVGYRYVLRALAEEGRSDVIYAMNNQSEKPGYGYQLAKGCTSLAEAWTADRSSSQNHFMLGQIEEWFYHDLVGLAPDPRAPGFKHVIIRPQPVEGIEWARARYESPHGPVAVLWRKAAHRFFLRVELPPNVSGEVWMKAEGENTIEESGEPAAKRPGVRLERREKGYAVFSIDSGNFDFAVTTQ